MIRFARIAPFLFILWHTVKGLRITSSPPSLGKRFNKTGLKESCADHRLLPQVGFVSLKDPKFGSSVVLESFHSASETSMVTNDEKVVLLIGSCGLDRLLTVSSYPQADAKVRSTAYHEIGGGNAANTASTMAFLSSASFLQSENLRIKLLTKVGDDYIGQQLTDELFKAGVDVSSALYRVGSRGTTTAFTSVIVSEAEHTRTCIHTPGTCGELTLDDVATVNMDELLANVVHIHSDSRHIEAALLVAQEARTRGIPISVDAEKDRHNPALDQLLEVATMIFTNSQQLSDYLHRRSKELEAKKQCLPLAEPVVVAGDRAFQGNPLKEIYANGIYPSYYFSRWGSSGSSSKEVIITKGNMGAMHVYCESQTSRCSKEANSDHRILVSHDEEQAKIVRVQQTVTEPESSGGLFQTTELNYVIHSTGVIPDAQIVDTTGAGDAFIGGYLLSLISSDASEDSIQHGLEFGAWVGGRKLSGPGARSALPRGFDVDQTLGRTRDEISNTLGNLLLPFGQQASLV